MRHFTIITILLTCLFGCKPTGTAWGLVNSDDSIEIDADKR